jgi:hypothetical protein
MGTEQEDEMSEGTNPTEWVSGAWSMEVGDYSIKCLTQEKPIGTWTVVVRENDRELEREVMTASWEKVWAFTEGLHAKYYPMILQAVRRAQEHRTT